MYDFKFADIGEGIHEGKILEWKYKTGDLAEEGETLVVIETDKVNAEIPLPVNGKIMKLGPKVGQMVNVGDTLALIDDGESQEAETDKKPDNEEAGVVGEIEVSDTVISSQTETVEATRSTSKTLATPVARKLAADNNLNIDNITGSGEHGRVLKTDIEEQLENKPTNTISTKTNNYDIPKLSVSNEDERVKISTLRRSVVKAMTISKQIIPHTTLIDELNVTELVAFRNNYKQQAKDQGVKLTYMAFIIKALTKAINTYPVFNSQFDQENEEIILKKDVNVGLAVDTPDGLIVPNIKNANQLSLFELANEVERLSTMAKNRKIQLNDLQKGTITITNFGAFDAISGTPIIKYPEVAILGIGKITKQAIVIDDKITIGDIIPLSLTFDHRIIDGADGGRFMMLFKKLLKDPLLLLMN